jgi:hypothetical protein
MMELPPYQYSVVIGLLLSDGWLILSSSLVMIRLFLCKPPPAPQAWPMEFN